MTPAEGHAWLRLILVVWSSLFLALLVRSLILAYYADYPVRSPVILSRRYPWVQRRPFVSDDRSELDREVLIFMLLIAVLGLLSIPGNVYRVLIAMPLPINQGSLIITGYTLVFARSSFVIWRLVRRERLRREPRRP